ncbi:hypothetical protein BGZ68_010928 [Mortierella alpina]|nr:hypothetical protein BGZ68_010928 [Mortierella alpina]
MTDSSPHDPTCTSSSAVAYEFSSPSHATLSSLKALPRPLSIRHSQSYEPAPPSPTETGPVTNSLKNSRSSASLNVLASSFSTAKSTRGSNKNHRSNSNGYESRPTTLPSRPAPFSNPFKRLPNPFGSGSKKSMDSGVRNNPCPGPDANTPDKTASSSAGSLTSWRTKGAGMLSKSWGRSQKNSEPLLSVLKGPAPNSPIFGADLEDAIRISHVPDTPLVPAVLYRCAVFLESRGVDEVGLYRVPGSHASVQKLKRMFDTGKDYDLLAMEGIDPNDIATLLKLYLRELPNPLLPPALLEQFQSLLSTDKHICHTLRGILIRLPRPSYVVLSYLCHHLSKIASHSDRTKMTISNLGVVFAPTLSIGSVLFKALLGGFYNGIDTPENRELGLKIVWGGLLQEMEYNVEEWSEDEDDEEIKDQQEWQPNQNAVYDDKEEYQESDTQEQHETYSEQPHHLIRHQQSMPAISPFSDHYASNSSTHFDASLGQTIVSLDLAGTQKDIFSNGDPFESPEAENDSDDSSEDVELMNAMLLREERAAKAAVPLTSGSEDGGSTVEKDTLASRANSRPTSHLIAAAMTPNGVTIASSTSTSSRSSGEGYRDSEQSISSLTAALPSAQLMPAVHVTITAGSMSLPAIHDGSHPDHLSSSPKSAMGAPQLPYTTDPISITL